MRGSSQLGPTLYALVTYFCKVGNEKIIFSQLTKISEWTITYRNKISERTITYQASRLFSDDCRGTFRQAKTVQGEWRGDVGGGTDTREVQGEEESYFYPKCIICPSLLFSDNYSYEL